MLIELSLIGRSGDRNDEAAFFHYTIGVGHRIGPRGFQNHVDVFHHIFEFRFGVIDRLIDAELFEQILVFALRRWR